jgi:putative membrane protein insertion efficiency factor
VQRAPQAIIPDELAPAPPHRDAARCGPLSRLARGFAIAAIGIYRAALRPHLAGSCRFHPTCSAYALECITRFGARRGGWLTLKRLARCRPFGKSGFDPAPADHS